MGPLKFLEVWEDYVQNPAHKLQGHTIQNKRLRPHCPQQQLVDIVFSLDIQCDEVAGSYFGSCWQLIPIQEQDFTRGRDD